MYESGGVKMEPSLQRFAAELFGLECRTDRPCDRCPHNYHFLRLRVRHNGEAIPTR